MRNRNAWLLLGGVGSTAASLLHVGILLCGPEWYRFFGAGERMARLAARGSAYPTIMTTVIALTLAVWALYAFSGAGVLRRLPFLRLALVLIAIIYLLRGLLGWPIVLLVDHPYALQLRARPLFMAVSSAISALLGVCYALGTADRSSRR